MNLEEINKNIGQIDKIKLEIEKGSELFFSVTYLFKNICHNKKTNRTSKRFEFKCGFEFQFTC